MKETVLNRLYVVEKELLDGIDGRDEVSMLLTWVSVLDGRRTRRLRGHLVDAAMCLNSRDKPAASREIREAIRAEKELEE